MGQLTNKAVQRQLMSMLGIARKGADGTDSLMDSGMRSRGSMGSSKHHKEEYNTSQHHSTHFFSKNNSPGGRERRRVLLGRLASPREYRGGKQRAADAVNSSGRLSKTSSRMSNSSSCGGVQRTARL